MLVFLKRKKNGVALILYWIFNVWYFRLIFIPEEELIEEEELTTPEFGDINTEFGSQAVLNPVDTETEPDLTDLETEDTENNDDQANSGSFRLSDIQEQLEEWVCLLKLTKWKSMKLFYIGYGFSFFIAHTLRSDQNTYPLTIKR